MDKWKRPSGIIEFFSDGSFTMNSESKQIAGRWNAVTQDRIKLTISVFGIESIRTLNDVVLAVDKLNYTIEENTVEFSRAK